jgi:hypothetical protein
MRLTGTVRVMVDAHVITIRDLRLRYDAPDVFAAQCSCGWMGDERRGRMGQWRAVVDGDRHREERQPPRTKRVP